jgi:hypothetical protein
MSGRRTSTKCRRQGRPRRPSGRHDDAQRPVATCSSCKKPNGVRLIVGPGAPEQSLSSRHGERLSAGGGGGREDHERDVGCVADTLQITRPHRSQNPASATSWTPQRGLQIRADGWRFAWSPVAAEIITLRERHTYPSGHFVVGLGGEPSPEWRFLQRHGLKMMCDATHATLGGGTGSPWPQPVRRSQVRATSGQRSQRATCHALRSL